MQTRLTLAEVELEQVFGTRKPVKMRVKTARFVLTSAENFVEQLGVALEVVQHFRGSESRLDVFREAGLIRWRVDAVGDAVPAAAHFLAALRQHVVDEQMRSVRMRRLGGDAGRMDVCENG